MSKINEEQRKVLNDLKLRIKDLIEISEYNMKNPERYDVSFHQLGAFNSVMALIEQIEKHGKINRGNEYFPDPIMVYKRDVMGKTLV